MRSTMNHAYHRQVVVYLVLPAGLRLRLAGGVHVGLDRSGSLWEIGSSDAPGLDEAGTPGRSDGRGLAPGASHKDRIATVPA